MLKYIIKRILVFIPTLLAISLITFIISINAPGDPVETKLKKLAGESVVADKLGSEEQYLSLKKKLGLDIPIFYFSFSTAATCDTLYKISRISDRETLDRMSATYGNWTEIAAYYATTKQLYAQVYTTPKDSSNAEKLIYLKNEVNELGKMYNEQGITQSLKNILDSASNNTTLAAAIPMARASLTAFENVKSKAQTWKTMVPNISWYGFNNQYHNWITNFFKGNYGISYQDDRPIKDKILDALGWTMLLNFMAILLTYCISIPLGVFSAVKKGSKTDKISTTLLFMLYSLPNFWIATMLIVFFCNPDFFAWFPTYGTGEAGNWLDIAYHLILPLFCIIYPSFAFLSRQMRGGMLTVLGQDYIRTAKAKGLSEGKVIWKHAIRNSLLPMITLFASIFPLAISGSFAIEFIFNLPGMGQLSLNAISARDYPMVFTVMMFSTILTLIGYLVSDILYAFADPRISFSKK